MSTYFINITKKLFVFALEIAYYCSNKLNFLQNERQRL